MYLVTIRSKIEILNLEMDHLGSVDFLIEILLFKEKFEIKIDNHKAATF